MDYMALMFRPNGFLLGPWKRGIYLGEFRAGKDAWGEGLLADAESQRGNKCDYKRGGLRRELWNRLRLEGVQSALRKVRAPGCRQCGNVMCCTMLS